MALVMALAATCPFMKVSCEPFALYIRFIRTHRSTPAGSSGPQGIGAPVTLEKGHMLSNEPGFYLEGQWGVRIESVLVCQEVEVHF